MLALLAQIAFAVPAVAVADLANHTGDTRYDPASAGTASMIVTKLAQIDDVRVVERMQLQQVLSEIELSRGGAVDDATRVEAGRIIGADFIVMGTLFSIAPGELTVNLRVVDTETAEVVRASDVAGRIGADGSGYFDLVNRLVDEVVDGLAIELTEAEKVAVTSIRLRELEALLKYGAVGADRPAAATQSQALWRDTSRDMMDEYQRLNYAVFTNGGARVATVRQFAELVGDQATLGQLQAARDTPRGPSKGLKTAGWVTLAMGAAIIPTAFLVDEKAQTPIIIAGGSTALLGGTFVWLGSKNRRGIATGGRAVGRGYSPEEADRWIDSYNRSLSESSSE